MNTYEVWAADLPGLGDSAMPPEPLTPASSASVVAAGIRALFPFERRLHLVGFSFGAQVGTLAAVGLGYQLQSLTIVGSAALGLPRARKRLPKEHPGMTAAERNAAHRATLEMLMFHDRRRIDDLTIRIQAENVRRARFRSRTFAFGDEIRRSLPAVRVPVNAVWGRHDATAELGPDACFAVLREHHPELVARTIEDAGHWVMHEQPDAFNAALVDMLALRE